MSRTLPPCDHDECPPTHCKRIGLEAHGSSAPTGSARNVLTLKWGTLKGWDLKTPEAVALLKKYHQEPVCYSVMMQRDTPNQKQTILDLIDLCDEITLDWEGKQVSRDEAKEYIRTYGQNDKLTGGAAPFGLAPGSTKPQQNKEE